MKRRWIAIAGLAVLLAASASSVAISQTSKKDDRPKAQKAELKEAFVAHLAEELGVSVDALTAAMKKAGIATIDDAVAKGLITKDQAALLKGRIEAGDAGDFGLGLGRFKHGFKNRMGARGWEKGHGFSALRALLADEKARDAIGGAVLETLGMSREELLRARGAGKEIEELLADKGVTKEKLGGAIADAAAPHLERLVKAGTIAAVVPDRLLERLRNGAGLGKIVRAALFG